MEGYELDSGSSSQSEARTLPPWPRLCVGRTQMLGDLRPRRGRFQGCRENADCAADTAGLNLALSPAGYATLDKCPNLSESQFPPLCVEWG